MDYNDLFSLYIEQGGKATPTMVTALTSYCKDNDEEWTDMVNCLVLDYKATIEGFDYAF